MNKTFVKIEDLTYGESGLVSIKRVKSKDPNHPKYQIQVAEKILNPRSSGNLLGVLNADDPRFGGKARRAWINASAEQIEKFFGISKDKLNALKEGEMIEDLNILNPKVGNAQLRIRIVETTTPDEFQKVNIDKAAKRAGKDGPFVYHKGQHIFSNATVVALLEGQEPEHVFLQGDAPAMTEGAAANADASEMTVD